MPTYSLKCSQCNHTWIAFMTISEREKAICPECGFKAETNYQDKDSSVLISGKGFYQEKTIR